MSNYFDIIIEGKSFYIGESDSKPRKQGAALEILKTIELVVSDKLKLNYKSEGLGSSKYELFKFLKSKALEIQTRYLEKQSTRCWVIRKFFSQKKEIEKICNKINHHVLPPQVMPLPNVLMQEMAEYLEVKDWKKLGKIEGHQEGYLTEMMVQRATKFGYEGCDYKGAVKYIDALFLEIEGLVLNFWIPKNYIFYKKGRWFRKLDIEKIAEALQGMSIEELIQMFSQKDIYHKSIHSCCEMTYFKKMLSKKKMLEAPKVMSPSLQYKGNTLLCYFARIGDINMVRFLLQQGVVPKNVTPLINAVRAAHADIVELLLENNVKVNARYAGATALSFACGFTLGYHQEFYYRPNSKVVEVLLKYGANPNIPDCRGFKPLQTATHKQLFAIVAVLLDHGVHL